MLRIYSHVFSPMYDFAYIFYWNLLQMFDAKVEKKRYGCTHCQKTFKCQGSLKSHVKKSHSGGIDSKEISFEVHDDIGSEDNFNGNEEKIQGDPNDAMEDINGQEKKIQDDPNDDPNDDKEDINDNAEKIQDDLNDAKEDINDNAEKVQDDPNDAKEDINDKVEKIQDDPNVGDEDINDKVEKIQDDPNERKNGKEGTNDNQKEDYTKQFDIVQVYVNDIKQEIEDNEYGDIKECTNDMKKEVLDDFSVKEDNNANPKEIQDDPNENPKATKNVANSGNINEEKGLTEVCRERKSGMYLINHIRF